MEMESPPSEEKSSRPGKRGRAIPPKKDPGAPEKANTGYRHPVFPSKKGKKLGYLGTE